MAGVIEELFEMFESYLRSQGLQARDGQIIDATLVPVPVSVQGAGRLISNIDPVKPLTAV